MNRFALCALLAASLGLAACDGATPTAPVKPATKLMAVPTEPGDGGGGGGCSTDCEPASPPVIEPASPPVIEYRLSVGLYRDGGDMKAYSRFYRGVNGYFTEIDAASLSVYCYVNGSQRDGETEHNASYTHITWGESYQYGKQITCNHSANYGAYTATTSYTM